MHWVSWADQDPAEKAKLWAHLQIQKKQGNKQIIRQKLRQNQQNNNDQVKISIVNGPIRAGQPAVIESGRSGGKEQLPS